MNKNKNNRNNYRRKIRNYNRKFRPYYRLPYRYKMSRYFTVINNKLQSFGAGQQFIVITKKTGIIADTIQYVNLSTVLNSIEFDKVKNDFNFFKIEYIILLFPPRNYPVSTNQDELQVNINFKSGDIEAPSILDNTRIVPTFFTNYRKLKYYVPHVCVNGYVLNAWLDRDNLMSATENIVLSFSAPGNQTQWRVRIELGIICRSPAQPSQDKIIIGSIDQKSCGTKGEALIEEEADGVKLGRKASNATI